jgi:hypothetical protein
MLEIHDDISDKHKEIMIIGGISIHPSRATNHSSHQPDIIIQHSL